MGLSVLGPLQVRSDGAEVPIRGVRKRRLIARLALTPDSPVSSEALMDAMWGDRPPRTARQSLHVHVSQLRDSLRGQGIDDLITTAVDGYRLGDAVDHIDVNQFQRLTTDGIAALQRGDDREARDLLLDALHLWHEPYPDLADHPGAMAERQRLIALHEQAVDDLAQARLALGEYHDLIEASQLTASPPLRERPYEQLIRAHLALGNADVAGEVLALAQHTFLHELGVHPSPELTAALETVKAPSSLPAWTPGTPARTIWEAISPHGRAVLVAAPDRIDTATLVADLGRLARDDVRPFAMASTRGGVASGLSPIAPLLDLVSADRVPALTGLGDRRRALHRALTEAIRDELGTGAIILIDGLEQATTSTLDYLTSVVHRADPLPVTFVLMLRCAPDDPRFLRFTTPEHPPITIGPELELTTTSMQDLPHLDEAATELLGLLEVCATPAPTELLVRASGLGVADGARAFRSLEAVGLVEADAAGRISLCRTAAPETAPTARTEVQRRHLALADALPLVFDAHDPYRIVGEAQHRLAALPHETETAWQATRRAVRFLEGFSGFAEVVTLLKSFVSDAGRAPDQQTPLPLDVHVALGRALVRSGHPASQPVLDQAAQRAREAGDTKQFAEAVRSMAEERAPQAMTAAMRDLHDEALAGLGDVVTDTRVQLLTDMAGAEYFAAPARAKQLGELALRVAHQSESNATIARALTGLVQVNYLADNPQERFDLAISAQEYARRAESTESLVLALTYEAAARIEQGQLSRAEAPLRYAAALARDVQVPRFRWWVSSWQATLAFAQADGPAATDRADAQFLEAFELWQPTDRTDPFDCFASQITAHRLLTSRVSEVADLVLQTAGEQPDLLVYQAVGAYATAALGRLDQSAELLAPFVANGLPERRDATWTTIMAMLAEAAILTETTDLGGPLREALQSVAHLHIVVNAWGGGGFYWGAARHAYALALLLEGDTDGAAQQFRRAAREQADAGAALFAQRSRDALVRHSL